MIRRAGAEDAVAVAHVHRSARAESVHPRPVTDAEWEGHLVRGDSTTFVWEQDGVIVAFATVLEDKLAALYVLPGMQGQRIGTGLLDVATGHGARRLEVYEDNDGARRFYERHGWTVDGPPADGAVRYLKA